MSVLDLPRARALAALLALALACGCSSSEPVQPPPSPEDAGVVADSGPTTKPPLDYKPPTIETSPVHGEVGVSVRRETIVTLPEAVDPGTVTPERFFATAEGERLEARVHVSPDRRRLTLFYADLLPGNARVRVTLNGSQILKDDGTALDADGNGVAGGVATIDFDTQALVPVPGTAFTGRVLEAGPSGTPLAGVLITVDGLESTARAETGADGRFHIAPVPAGRVFVHIDGQRVRAGDGYFPFVGKAWRARPGLVEDVGTVYLPRIADGTLVQVSRTQPTTVELPAQVRAGHPELEGVRLEVPADALFSDDGSRGGAVGIAPVPPDQLPGPLPEGWMFPVVITVQTNGPQNFDRPVGACFPNLPDPATGATPAPGESSTLYSYDHDRGEWGPVGPMQVSADGRLVCSTSGTGVLAPGWHASGPPPIESSGWCPSDPSMFKIDSYTSCVFGCAQDTAANIYNCLAASVICILSNKLLDRIIPGLGWLNQKCSALNLQCHKDGADAQNVCAEACRQCTPQIRELKQERPVPELTAEESEVADLQTQALTLRWPFDQAMTPPPANVEAMLADLEAALEARTGGDPVGYWLSRARAITESSTASPPGLAPTRPIPWAALTISERSAQVVRGVTGPNGRLSLFLPRGSTLHTLALFDPVEGTIDRLTERTGRAGTMPAVRMKVQTSTAPDFDHDGLTDLAEEVLGTRPDLADTDGDGVSDGAEIDAASDPLDGRPTITGVIGAADTPGEAKDVCVSDKRAVVLDSLVGLIALDVSDPITPVRLGRLPMQRALRVACAGTRVVVAAEAEGVRIVDLTDPAAPQVERTVSAGSPVTAVAVDGAVIYAGTQSGEVVAFDLATGRRIGAASFGAPVEDLAVDGDLVVAVGANELGTFGVFPAFDQRLGRAAISLAPAANTPRRVSAGGGRAWVSTYAGFDAFSLANPTTPALLGPAVDDGQYNFFKQIVPTGSGFGVAAAGARDLGDGTHHAAVYDLRDPARTDIIVAALPTAGITWAVALDRGLAYAADGPAGFATLNFLSPDTAGRAPTVDLRSSFDPSRPVEAGKRLRATAQVSDDVLVSHVDFLIDSQRVASDGSFPFELRFQAPPARFRLEAVAVDTGGNRASTSPWVVDVEPDRTAPRVLRLYPDQDARLVSAPASVSATFDEDLDASQVAQGLGLFFAGADGALGTSDDQAVAGAVHWEPSTSSLVFLPSAPLASGTYGATVAASLTDVAGNPLAATTTWRFTVVASECRSPPAASCGPSASAAGEGCAVLASGAAKCWGIPFAYGEWNDQVAIIRGDGPGEMGAALPVVPLPTGRYAAQTVTRVGAARYTACFRLDDGSIRCVGDQEVSGLPPLPAGRTFVGEEPADLGDGMRAIFFQGGQRAIDMTVGQGYGCAILEDGSVRCWGWNAEGGHGSLTDGLTVATAFRNVEGDTSNDHLHGVDLGAGRRATRIRAFKSTTCALLDDGTVKCWGGCLGWSGDLGDALAPVDLGAGASRATDLSVGAGDPTIGSGCPYFACVLFDDGQVRCWGGDPRTNPAGAPLSPTGNGHPLLPLGTAFGAVSLEVGFLRGSAGSAVCFRASDGETRCTPGSAWPTRGGQPVDLANPLPDGSHWPPIDPGTGRQVSSLAHGGQCAFLDDGTLKCVGGRVCGLPTGCGPVDNVANGDAIPVIELE